MHTPLPDPAACPRQPCRGSGGNSRLLQSPLTLIKIEGITMTTAPPPPPHEEEPSGIPDDVWEKFAEDTPGKIRASAPKEPSARARMVTARLRAEDAAAEATEGGRRWKVGRKGGRTSRPNEPEGWRTGPAWREMRRAERGPWRDRARTLLIVAVVAGAVLVALDPSGARSLVLGHGHGHASDSATLPPETAMPTAAPTTEADDVPTVSHPFTGSPALHWADGANGIVVPRATRVGDLTEQQVAAVLRTTKAYLVATNLDPAALRGGYPSAALRLVDPLNGEPAQMKAALRSPGANSDPSDWFTRYDPARVALVGEVIKVRGRITFAEAAHGSVRVHTDYSYVYAFTKAGDRSGQVARVIVRRVVETQWYPASTPGKVEIVAVGASFGGSGCGFDDGYLHPFPWESPSATPPAGPTTDPYDRSKPLPTAKGCGTASRT